MARTIAASLQGRDDLLYRGPTGEPHSAPGTVRSHAAAPSRASPSRTATSRSGRTRQALGSVSTMAATASAFSPACTSACSMRCWTCAMTSSSSTLPCRGRWSPARWVTASGSASKTPTGAERQVFFSATGPGDGARAAHRNARVRSASGGRRSAHRGRLAADTAGISDRAADAALAAGKPLRRAGG